MKIKYKKYLYAINDLTNILLKKETDASHIELEQLRKSFKIVSISLIISIMLNIVLIINLFIYG